MARGSLDAVATAAAIRPTHVASSSVSVGPKDTGETDGREGVEVGGRGEIAGNGETGGKGEIVVGGVEVERPGIVISRGPRRGSGSTWERSSSMRETGGGRSSREIGGGRSRSEIGREAGA